MKFQITFIGMVQRFTDITSKMNISRCYQCRTIFFFDCHDAVKRVLGTLACFHVMHEMHDIVAMSDKKHPLQS